MAYRLGIITQTFTTTTTNDTHSGAIVLISIAIGIGIAFIPAVIASNKGRSFGLWYLFGLLCWLPALVVSLVISDNRAGAAGAWDPSQAGWSGPPPNTTPAGWYPDPGGTTQQRYWDGFRWTENLR